MSRSGAAHFGRWSFRLHAAVTWMLLCSAASISSAQGLVSFMNTDSTLIMGGPPGNATAITGPVGSYYFGLFTAPVGTTDRYAFVFTGIYATNSIVPGRISGGVVAVPGWPAGEARAFMIYGWPASDGPMWNNAWLSLPPGGAMGWSAMATGVAGGTDAHGESLPVLHLFGGTAISSGFNLDDICLSCNPPQVMSQPQDQTVAVGMDVQFQVHVMTTPGSLCQWYCNGAPLEGATSFVLQLVNVRLSQNGNRYYVIVGNPWGTAISDTVTLTVTPGPLLVAAPLSQTAEAGSNVRFFVTARGLGPLGYQWNWNSVPLPSRTSFVLTLAGVQPAQGGSYTVTVTNSYGALTSSVAVLNVVQPVPRATVPGLLLQGRSGTAIHVEFKPALSHPGPWSSRDTITLTNNQQWYFDSSAPLVQGFYRTSQDSSPWSGPLLSLQEVAAISVTGAIGSSQRLEYINQFGPIDAWQPLATVFLTNSNQLFFDSSSIGQPPRLYRLLPGP